MNHTLYNKGIVINAGCFFFKGQESPTSFLKLKGLLLIHFSRQCLGHMHNVVSCTAEVYYFFKQKVVDSTSITWQPQFRAISRSQLWTESHGK